MSRATLCLPVLALLALLAGCAAPSAPLSVTDRDTIAACRNQAQTAYEIRHRAEIYSIHERDTPYSGMGLLRSPTQDLSDRYEQEHQIDTCVRNTGTGPGGTARP
jgi:hypothetical protein